MIPALVLPQLHGASIATGHHASDNLHRQSQEEVMLGKFDRGSGTAWYDVADDGIVCAGMSGLVVPANAGELSALVLKAGSDRAAIGVLCSVRKALIALPAIDPRHYAYVPQELRSVPVAVLVTPEQMAVYRDIAQAAALSGTIRRAFLSPEEAQRWIREQARAMAANRVWWPGHRSLP